MIYILNYEAGNIKSIVRAIAKLGYKYSIINSYNKIINRDILLIPGVGNFHKSSKKLKENGFFDIKYLSPENRPYVIGICLGMQLLFSKGFEGGESEGLDLIKGFIQKTPNLDMKNKKIKDTLIGWESLSLVENNFTPRWLKKFSNNSFYHIHSYMACPVEEKNIYGRYPNSLSFIPSVVGCQSNRTIGFQFHPEKSGLIGLELLNQAIKNAV